MWTEVSLGSSDEGRDIWGIWRVHRMNYIQQGGLPNLSWISEINKFTQDSQGGGKVKIECSLWITGLFLLLKSWKDAGGFEECQVIMGKWWGERHFLLDWLLFSKVIWFMGFKIFSCIFTFVNSTHSSFTVPKIFQMS